MFAIIKIRTHHDTGASITSGCFEFYKGGFITKKQAKWHKKRLKNPGNYIIIKYWK